jgi:hypothetical protein
MGKERPEALQRAIILMHNRQVREYFKDIPDGDLSDTPRASTKRLLMLEDNDSLVYCIQAMQFFKQYCEDANGINELYFSVPISTYNIAVGYLPQITIYFRQEFDASAGTETRDRARTMQVSFRVRESKIPTSTAALRAIAADIRQQFGTPLYRFRTGYRKVSYFNKQLGYEFKVSCREVIDAENLIKDCMGLLNDRDEYDERDLKISESKLGAASATAVPRKTRVVSRLVNLPIRDRSVRMYFSHADYKCYPAKPILLVRGNALVY